MDTGSSSQKTNHYLTKNITIPFVIIVLVNLISSTHLIPVSVQLLFNSTCCVYIGCVLSSKLAKKQSGELTKAQKLEHEEGQSVGLREATKFPIIASIFLCGFYLLYKFVNKDIVNYVITFLFCFQTVIQTSNILQNYISFSEQMKKVIKHVNPWQFLKKNLKITEFDLSYASIITTILSSIPVILFYITKHWFLNNFFGIFLSIFALKSINLSSFRVGFILLWLLFFYDIFWVYGTDVMVTVAKNLDIPIKLMFPYSDETGVQKFSMLGLGDIVIPGIFVGLCLKFDIDNALNKLKIINIKDIKTNYFNTCMIGYILGIIETFAVMWIFNHPQPALLFLVPMCTLPVAGLAFYRQEFKDLKIYSTDDPLKKKEQKDEQKGILDNLFDKVHGFFVKNEVIEQKKE